MIRFRCRFGFRLRVSVTLMIRVKLGPRVLIRANLRPRVLIRIKVIEFGLVVRFTIALRVRNKGWDERIRGSNRNSKRKGMVGLSFRLRV